MPSHEEHCQHSFERYGVRGDDIHAWIDEPSRICPQCGQVINENVKFCPECGKEVPIPRVRGCTCGHLRSTHTIVNLREGEYGKCLGFTKGDACSCTKFEWYKE